MTIKIDGEEKRIGLALSGGGFRAAGFHLGVMCELQRRGILPKLDLISCLSGGSIAGATLVSNRGNPAAAFDALETYLRTKSIAVASFIGGVLDPFETRLEKLADSYDRDLFSGKKMSALRNGPRIYFLSTNLATGNMFFFVAGGGKPEEMGEHELGTVPAPDFLICRAVAASSAFPPVFPTPSTRSRCVSAGSRRRVRDAHRRGVYDNMGISPLLRTVRNPLDSMIVSDGGKPFSIDERPTESGAIVLKAGLDIMTEQIRGLEFDRMEHRWHAKMGPKPLWFSIDSGIGEKQSGDASFASSIGTNLKRLSAEELAVLTRHGGALLSARIDQYAPELKSIVV